MRGKLSPVPHVCMNRSDHPRACGANYKTRLRGRARSGSSPRMRGKRQSLTAKQKRQRIIPAHAGQTTRRGCGGAHVPDHPRACGANCRSGTPPRGGIGSSPRMRGKPVPAFPALSVIRIIPAHAGQTSTGLPSVPHCTDHPRACGANVSPTSFNERTFGSSPRMRGKLHSLNFVFGVQRIIPAHAGQTYH